MMNHEPGDPTESQAELDLSPPERRSGESPAQADGDSSSQAPTPSPYKPPPQLRPSKRPRRRSGARPIVTRVGLLAALALVIVVVAATWAGRSWIVGTTASTDNQGPVAKADSLTAVDVRPELEAAEDLKEHHAAAHGEIDSSSRGGEPETSNVDRDSAIDLTPRRMARIDGPPKIALVIDDLGRSVAMTRRLLELKTPMSFAVLPFEVRTAEVTATLREADAEILVHLPMQGQAGADPGPGALLPEMTESELRSATLAALGAVPGAVGVNNHMGSVLSADSPAMRTILSVVSEQGKFFLDSRTTAETVGFSMARALGVPAAERQVFLDGDRDPEKIREQFRRALDVATERGFAVAIGHPYPSTLEVLEQELDAARDSGYEFVRVSALLERDSPAAAVADSDL